MKYFMQIKVNLNIFLFLILFIITNQIGMYAIIMVFALIHELAHLTVGILLGFEVDVFRIMPFGFSIEFKAKIEDYNKKVLKSNKLTIKKILIAMAGPFTNLLIIIIGKIFKLQTDIIYANLLILIFNLLPIYPLDGGRALKNLLKMFLENRKAYNYTNLISNISFIMITMLFSILILIYHNISFFLIIIFLLGIMLKENKKYYTYCKTYKTIDKYNNYL